jgi:hypothetical protein
MEHAANNVGQGKNAFEKSQDMGYLGSSASRSLGSVQPPAWGWMWAMLRAERSAPSHRA